MSAKHPFTNSLIHETSPYLLQHAHNPVEWVAWSNEIFEEAKSSNKPILLSIGYSACHWCHVMERESFEDASTAAFMNAHFINVKLDREERPDIDHLYMEALQAMTGSGGWPLNIFLLPDGKPFYGGTYFPPIEMHNRPSWLAVLNGVHEAYKNNPSKIMEQATQLTQHLVATNIAKSKEEIAATNLPKLFTPATSSFNLLIERVLHNADTTWGGFGNAPKFPQTFSLQILLRSFYHQKNEAAMVHAVRSIDKMIQGGIYDAIGGGFSRYSVDAQWMAPHFEKMTYDNALFISLLSEAYQITGKESYAFVIEQTFQFLQRELFNGSGGYYAALDADSEGVEGKYYTWSYEELKQLIDPALFHDFCTYFQIQEAGNWEHTNILWTQHAFEDGLSASFLRIKEQLFQYRAKRIRPATDEKIIFSWNNLLVTAFSKAYAALGNMEYKLAAVKCMEWIESNLYNASEDYFYHTNTNGVKKAYAFLDDYASLIIAYIQLHEITGEPSYLLKSKKWMKYVLTHFLDEEGLFFYYTASYQKDILLRKKEHYDGAQPSGNALACQALYCLGTIFDLQEWKNHAGEMLRHMEKNLLQYPNSYGVWAHTYYLMTAGVEELVCIGETVEKELPLLLKPFWPNKLLFSSTTEDAQFPLSKGRKGTENQFFICKKNTCSKPFLHANDILANS